MSTKSRLCNRDLGFLQGRLWVFLEDLQLTTPLTPWDKGRCPAFIRTDVQQYCKIFQGKDLQWALETTVRFTVSFLETLELFPNFRVSPSEVTILFPDVHTPADLVDQIKSACLFPMSSLMKSEVSPAVPCAVPLRGRARKYYKQHFKTRISRRKLTFANTLLQLKRVCPAVPDSYVQVCLEKHKQAVSNDVPHPKWWHDRIVSRARTLCEEIGMAEWQPPEILTDFSTHSCVENSIRGGGIFGFVKNLFPSGDLDQAFSGDLRYLTVDHGWRFPYFEELLSCAGRFPYYMRKAVALKEPLKVRVITKTHYWESPLWADFQKEFRDKLALRKEVFSGRELVLEDFQALEDQLVECEALHPKEWVFVSDDASAATDSIHPSLTVDSVIDCIPPHLKDIFRDSFGGEYSFVEYPDGDVVNQTGAQLMGDRRSFVILTVLHLSVKLEFLHTHGLSGLPVPLAVNGDDGIIAIPRDLVPSYFRWVSNFWKLNPLKTFVQRNFISFNSTTYQIRNGLLTAIPLLRWNLCRRWGVENNQDPRIWNEIARSAQEFAPLCKGAFLQGWAPVLNHLRKYSPDLCYQAPLCCGGLGLKGFGGYMSGKQHAVNRSTEKLLYSCKEPPWGTKVVGAVKQPGRQRLVLPWTRKVFVPRTVKYQGTNRFPGTFKRRTESNCRLRVSPLPAGWSPPGDYAHLYGARLERLTLGRIASLSVTQFWEHNATTHFSAQAVIDASFDEEFWSQEKGVQSTRPVGSRGGGHPPLNRPRDA